MEPIYINKQPASFWNQTKQHLRNHLLPTSTLIMSIALCRFTPSWICFPIMVVSAASLTSRLVLKVIYRYNPMACEKIKQTIAKVTWQSSFVSIALVVASIALAYFSLLAGCVAITLIGLWLGIKDEISACQQRQEQTRALQEAHIRQQNTLIFVGNT